MTNPQIAPPDPAGSSAARAEATATERTAAATTKTSASGKFVEFIGTKKLAASHVPGSHYLITKTQLVEAGVPADECFADAKDGDQMLPVFQIEFGPANGYRVPVEAFGKAALNRLLQEPDLILVDTKKD